MVNKQNYHREGQSHDDKKKHQCDRQEQYHGSHNEQVCSHGCQLCGDHGQIPSRACITLVPIFNHLDEHQLDEIMDDTKSASFQKGEIIYRAGQQSESLYIVSKGRIRIYRLSESGKEQLLRILHPGDFTGELALFRQSVHESYAEAMMDTDVCLITRNDLQKFLVKYPTIALRVLAEFSDRLDESEKQAARVATEKVETRIALYLAECVENQGGGMDIILPMTRKDLASYLGTTPETISRKLADLEEQGYIKQMTGRKIQVLDMDGLLLV